MFVCEEENAGCKGKGNEMEEPSNPLACLGILRSTQTQSILGTSMSLLTTPKFPRFPSKIHTPKLLQRQKSSTTVKMRYMCDKLELFYLQAELLVQNSLASRLVNIVKLV